MKLLILALVTFSLNSFAGNFGYNCVPSNKAEEVKLDKVAARLGSNYLGSIKVLVVSADKCAFAQVGNLKDHCLINGIDLNIYQANRAELVLNAKNKIRLICEEDRTAYSQPAGGGSN